MFKIDVTPKGIEKENHELKQRIKILEDELSNHKINLDHALKRLGKIESKNNNTTI